MSYEFQNIEQQHKLAKEKLKKLLKKEHGLENAVFDPNDYLSQDLFESYFIELNQLGLD